MSEINEDRIVVNEAVRDCPKCNTPALEYYGYYKHMPKDFRDGDLIPTVNMATCIHCKLEIYVTHDTAYLMKSFDNNVVVYGKSLTTIVKDGIDRIEF